MSIGRGNPARLASSRSRWLTSSRVPNAPRIVPQGLADYHQHSADADRARYCIRLGHTSPRPGQFLSAFDRGSDRRNRCCASHANGLRATASTSSPGLNGEVLTFDGSSKPSPADAGLWVNPMQRFSTWVRRIATAILVVIGTIFTGVVFPIVVHFIEQQPRETANVVLKFLKFLLDLSEQTWLRVTALLLCGFVAGLWLDWLLRRLDGSRAEERKDLGYEMVRLCNELRGYTGQVRSLFMYQARPKIVSCFTTARKLGIWVPDDPIFSINPSGAIDVITEHLMDVGTMLKDGHFSEAKQHAKSRSAAFSSAYAKHGLSPRRITTFSLSV